MKKIGGKSQHIYNPSNFAIVATLFLMPWVGIAPPYHFTENVVGIWNWIIRRTRILYLPASLIA